MLKDNFFTILSFACVENSCTYRVALNGSHPIFKAHFAGNPIMPGACILQMIKELASDYLDKELFICSVKNMKFLNVIDPFETSEISVQIGSIQQEDENISLTAVLQDEDKVFSKSKLLLKLITNH